MSYDIELKNKVTGETAKMRHPQYVRGGTVRAEVNERTGQLVQAEQVEADINITCNYSHYYYEATDGDPRFAHDEVSAYYADGTQGPIKTEYGIRGLYGKTPAESIPMLIDMITKSSINIQMKMASGLKPRGKRPYILETERESRNVKRLMRF